MPRRADPWPLALGDKRPVDFTDDDIRALVANRTAETQDLDFKATFNHQDPKAPPKMLRHVASFANGGGGYLIFGVREDGHGRALRFQGVQNAEAIAKSIRSLCLAHLDPRVQGLEVHRRVVDTHELILVRVPRSARIPHMMKYADATEFWTRHGDGKVQMTREEIREAFLGGPPRVRTRTARPADGTTVTAREVVASGIGPPRVRAPRAAKQVRRAPLVHNGSFEQGLLWWGTGVFEGVPKGRASTHAGRFLQFGGAVARWFPDTREAYSGLSSLRVEHESSYTPHVFSTLSQRIAVEPGAAYDATFWIKVEQKGRGAFCLRVVPSRGEWDRFKVKIDEGVADWRRYTVRFHSGLQPNVDLRFVAEGPIKAWIDDVAVRKVSEPRRAIAVHARRARRMKVLP